MSSGNDPERSRGEGTVDPPSVMSGVDFGFLAGLIDAVPDAIVVLRPDMSVRYSNDAARRVVGASGPAADLNGLDALDAVDPADIAHITEVFEELLAQPGAVAQVRFRIITADGPLAVEATASNLIDNDPIGGVVVSFRDLTGEEDKARAVDRLAGALQATTDLVVIHDAAGVVLHANAAAERFFGGHPVGLTAADLYPPQTGSVIERVALPSAALHGSWSGEAVMRQADATLTEVSLVVTVQRNPSGHLDSFAVIARDISRRAELERALSFQALHDPLTGLANRVALLEHLERALPLPEGFELGVLFIDLDNFKVVNDSLGHHLGDELLRQAATRITAMLRSDDLLARFGGDEFVAVVGGLPAGDGATEEAGNIAQRICAAFRDPMALGETEVYVGASVGVAMADGVVDAEKLIRNADLAMYAAKSAGRGRAAFFDVSLRREAQRRLEGEARLHHAVERGELDVVYQPVVSLPDRRLTGFEALVRWRDRDGAVLLPGDFLDLAEHSGLTTAIDTFVLTTACTALAEWTERFEHARTLSIAVNLSPRQLARGDLPGVVAGALASAGLEPHRLVLEITEGELMNGIDDALAAVAIGRSLGVRLAIDDFGTGHSALAYLRQFAVDSLKIDRSFVAGLSFDPASTVIIEAMIQLATTFGLAVVAEGVEHEHQVDHLVRLGCRAAQGYLLGEPMSAERASELVASSEPDGDGGGARAAGGAAPEAN